jgi:hypothetical protein
MSRNLVPIRDDQIVPPMGLLPAHVMQIPCDLRHWRSPLI